MLEIPVVKKEEAELARAMEQRILDAREDAGILFVGVSVQPTLLADDSPLYSVWVGCDRSMSEDLIGLVVAQMFHLEILNGLKIEVKAHRGVIRT